MSGSALIGFTGFVGGTLHRAGGFDLLINSKNTNDLRGGSFDLVICAGVPAAKWLANEQPERDRNAIASIRDALDTTEIRELILISTIDVYCDPSAPSDENCVIDASRNHPYGRHRFELERWVANRFRKTRIVRLPALFGDGLKKNVIFDLLHGNQTEKINPLSAYQWYPLRRLASDIERIRACDIELINLFPEPIQTAEILKAFFPGAKVGSRTTPAPAYGLRTRYSDIFGGPPGYMLDRIAVLGELAGFIAQERNSLA
jgi:nucleoside-diphosphate-sugar epimerase